ncbi:MAG: hypothetical protein KC933_32330, partial [Myxococcales bacterium]|nr:hypothetical protein [Myxococcales bacterium]
VNEQLIFALVGEGSNGKSVLLDVLDRVLGDLVYAVPDSVIQPGRGDAHPTELMGFKGARLAFASETKREGSWSVAQMKKLRSSEAITARLMGQDFVSFQPTHTLWLISNHRPNVGPGETAFWRSYREVHFPTIFRREGVELAPGELRADPGLTAHLIEHETPVVLRWLVEGWEAYRSEGLREPQAVMAASAEAQAEASPFSVFAREAFTLAPGESVPASAAFALWQAWKDQSATLTHLRPNVARDISVLATELGVEYVPNRGGASPALISGLALTPAGQDLARELADRGPYSRGPKISSAALEWLREHAGLRAVSSQQGGPVVGVTAPARGGFGVATVTSIQSGGPFAAG